ncbi:MAG: hypothetical protein Q9196_001093 [Gyalolechia fulgens]
MSSSSVESTLASDTVQARLFTYILKLELDYGQLATLMNKEGYACTPMDIADHVIDILKRYISSALNALNAAVLRKKAATGRKRKRIDPEIIVLDDTENDGSIETESEGPNMKAKVEVMTDE